MTTNHTPTYGLFANPGAIKQWRRDLAESWAAWRRNLARARAADDYLAASFCRHNVRSIEKAYWTLRNDIRGQA